MRAATSVDMDIWERVGQALSDRTRRGVLAILVSGSAYPSDLADALGVSRSLLSNHLACLRGCGFVTASFEGRRVRYELADPGIADALARLSDLPLGPCSEHLGASATT